MYDIVVRSRVSRDKNEDGVKRSPIINPAFALVIWSALKHVQIYLYIVEYLLRETVVSKS